MYPQNISKWRYSQWDLFFEYQFTIYLSVFFKFFFLGELKLIGWALLIFFILLVWLQVFICLVALFAVATAFLGGGGGGGGGSGFDIGSLLQSKFGGGQSRSQETVVKVSENVFFFLFISKWVQMFFCATYYSNICELLRYLYNFLHNLDLNFF